MCWLIFWALNFGLTVHGHADGHATESTITSADLHRVAPEESPKGPEYGLIDHDYHGHYSRNRTAFHEQLVEEHLLPVRPSQTQPEAIFTMGPFGAGKNTVLQHLVSLGALDRQTHVFIDIDAVRERIPEFQAFNEENRQTTATRTQKEAGYIAELIFWRAILSGRSVVFNSSLKNTEFAQTLLAKIRRKAPTYRDRLSLLFIRADLPIVLARVHDRNRVDPRTTSDEAAIDSYYRTESGFESLAAFFDSVAVVDTSRISQLVYFEKQAGAKRQRRGTQQPLSALSRYSPAASRSRAGLTAKLEWMSRQRPKTPVYDVFIDIDWTTFYTLHDPSQVPRPVLPPPRVCSDLFRPAAGF
ncbi:MAG: zeta toxin family protein [Bdellovibrionaceae bacterium]|nr:zeta toxin family protein [Pseudobdellovibrionaceae bacterium]